MKYGSREYRVGDLVRVESAYYIFKELIMFNDPAAPLLPSLPYASLSATQLCAPEPTTGLIRVKILSRSKATTELHKLESLSRSMFTLIPFPNSGKFVVVDLK